MEAAVVFGYIASSSVCSNSTCIPGVVLNVPWLV